MEPVGLVIGLAALGYSLAKYPTVKKEEAKVYQPMETFINPASFEEEAVTFSQDKTSHNNMVPFFGAKITQSTYSGATDSLLGTHTGSGGGTFRRKEEVEKMFKPEMATGLPFGLPVETDFEQSRQVSSARLHNVAPIEKMLVGPGVNDGYTNEPSGGYQQDSIRDFALPRTTDEIRTANKPKITYGSQMIPGTFYIKEMGIQAPVKKNRPDRFQVLIGEDGQMNHVNTTMGARPGGPMYPGQIMKEQQRESTNTDHMGAPMSAANGYLSYVRALSEPFQQFMKLTAEGRPSPAAPGQGGNLLQGPEGTNFKNDKDESLLVNVRKFEAPLMSVGGQAPVAANIGSVKQYNSLPEVNRNEGSILEAFKSNPFTKSLQSH
jgi:hypothetical protein